MATTYLTHTFGSAGSLTTWTLSVWVKKVGLGIEQRIFNCDDDASGNNDQWMKFDGSDILQFSQYQSGYTQKIETNRKFRDCSAYYHIVLVWDTTNASAGDRTRVYVNGVRETSFSSEVQASSSLGSLINNTTYPFEIGRRGLDGSQYFPGNLSNIAFVDGTALDPTSFGETDSTSGIWKFKPPSGITWGTNGFWLKGENSANLGLDSANSNNFTTGGGTPTQSIDTPSNVYCALNPTVRHQGTISYGNTRYDNGGSSWYGVPSTFGFEKGKWFYEYKCTTITSWSQVGLMSSKPSGGYNDIYSTYVGNNSGGVALNSGNGDIYQDGSSGTTWFSGGLSAGDIIGVAIDADNSKIYFSKDGVWGNSSDPVAGTNGQTLDSNFTDYKPYLPCFSVNNFVIDVNFGTGYFGSTAVSSAGTSSTNDDSVWEFDCPTGYYGISTKNINTYG